MSHVLCRRGNIDTTNSVGTIAFTTRQKKCPTFRCLVEARDTCCSHYHPPLGPTQLKPSWVPSSSSTQPRSCTPSSRASRRAAVSTASPSSRRLVVKPARSESEHLPPVAAQGTTTMKSSVPVPSRCRASSSPPARDARLQPSLCPALTLPSEGTSSHP